MKKRILAGPANGFVARTGKRIPATLIALAVVLFAADHASALTVVNGDFETGDLTGWSLSGETVNDLDYSGVDSSVPHAGEYGFYSGAPDGGSYLEQVFETTAGQEYTLSFWVSRDEQSDPFAEPFNSFMVFWNRDYWTPVFELQNFLDPIAYAQYSISLQAADAESLLSFYFFDSQSFINLDDVSVTAADNPASVPVPGAMTLMASGLVGLAGLRRKKSGS